MAKKVGLIILDGWGIGDQSKSDAVFNAKTPFFDGLLKQYSNSQLLTSGTAVGLPDGQMGNSEVGHLNIGAGRIVYQELTRINKSIEDKSFFNNETLVNAIKKAKKENRNIHIMGLVSDGGVHSSQNHLHAICDLIHGLNCPSTYIHAFTDGRDCDPKSGKACLKKLSLHIEHKNIKIASVVGRYYAMDRDERWERIAKAYHLMVNGEGQVFDDVEAVFDYHYENEITDEFINPSKLTADFVPIQENDLLISFNFRTDRPREIVMALSQKYFEAFNMKKLNLEVLTMTNYDQTFNNIQVIFEKDNLTNTLGETISKNNLTQIRIAETEKYPHVTFFFSGGREIPFQGESRILVNSPKVATYDLQPEMSALEVADKLKNAIISEVPDFFCLNFANPDMVGHTGVYDAIVKAVETVDEQLKLIVETAQKNNYELFIIADHGNADFVINNDGSPNTAHSLNPVPCIFVSTDKVKIHDGILADIAPSILNRMQLEIPKEMTGKVLVEG